MFTHYRTQGFILKKEARGEADLLFTAYTKDFGKLKILGKAVRKINSKLRPAAEIFYLSEIEFIQGKSWKTMTDAILIDKFPGIRNDLEKIKVSQRIAEALDDLITGQEADKRIWQLLIETFQKLNSTKRLEIVYHYFYWNLISILGYRPELYYCLGCRKKIISKKNYFSPKDGGIVCADCGPARIATRSVAGGEISPEAIKILRLIIKKDWATLLKLKFEAQYLKELICGKL